MRLTRKQRRGVRFIHKYPKESFVEISRAVGLDPASSFRAADLRGVDFGDDDLSGFDFTDADLRGANLEGARLSGARLENVDLTTANLKRIEAREALFLNVTAAHADLGRSDQDRAGGLGKIFPGRCADDGR